MRILVERIRSRSEKPNPELYNLDKLSGWAHRGEHVRPLTLALQSARCNSYFVQAPTSPTCEYRIPFLFFLFFFFLTVRVLSWEIHRDREVLFIENVTSLQHSERKNRRTSLLWFYYIILGYPIVLRNSFNDLFNVSPNR